MPSELYGGYSNTITKNLMLIKYNDNQKKNCWFTNGNCC